MSSATKQYRFDLDGLRGIAIALVVLFHVYVGRVSGGVDVFLLLSGFFFLGAQYRNAINPRQSINPWWSIWRTMRRLLPGLVLVLAFVAVAVIAFFPQLRTRDNALQLQSSLLYFQNYTLARQGADYAAADAETSPLQHLWSMSVQGQFYVGAILLVSLLAWATRRRDVVGSVTDVNQARLTDATGGRLIRILEPTLWVLTFISAAYAFYVHSVDQGWNYYSTLTRLWELLLGAALGLALSRRTITLPKWCAVPVAAIGLALVVSTGFLFDGAAQFPGPWTLWPLVGAALVIVAGPNAGFVSTFLSSRSARELGQIAYALYLWHWPLLILATQLSGQETPSIALGTAVIAISVVLAWITNRFVETPLAQSSRRPHRTQAVATETWHYLRTRASSRYRATVALAYVVVIAMMLALPAVQQSRIENAITGKLDPTTYPGVLAVSDGMSVPKAAPKPDKDIITDLWPEPALDGCITQGGEPIEFFVTTKRWRDSTQPCIFGDANAQRKIVMIGGSHMEHWFAPIDVYAKKHGYQLHVLLRQGCPATLAPIQGVGEVCNAWTEQALKRIDDIDPDVVFTTSTRPRFQLDEPAFGDYTPDGYIKFFDALQERGINFVAIRDNPWAIAPNFNQFAPTNCEDPNECLVERRLALSPDNPAEDILADYSHGLSVDFSDLFCDDEFCQSVIGNIYVYRDSNHITDELSMTFAPELERRVAGFLS